MKWVTDEVLFYGGMIIILVSLCIGVVMFLLLKLKKYRLTIQLDKEYGNIDRKKVIGKRGK